MHGVHLGAPDIEILNQHDAFLVHNARSNMNNNVGYAEKLPTVKNVALGTDGIGVNMFEEVKCAYFKHKDTGGAYWPGDYLRFLQNGNTILERYFGEKYGKVAAGYKADLTIYDYDAPTPAGRRQCSRTFCVWHVVPRREKRDGGWRDGL